MNVFMWANLPSHNVWALQPTFNLMANQICTRIGAKACKYSPNNIVGLYGLYLMGLEGPENMLH
jgi:hypothetical protein